MSFLGIGYGTMASMIETIDYSTIRYGLWTTVRSMV